MGGGGVVGEGMKKWKNGMGGVVLLFSLTDDSFKDFTGTVCLSLSWLSVAASL